MKPACICCLAIIASGLAIAGDWPDWRGPNRDGISRERNLPTKWSPSGENLAWRAPYGGRSAPVAFGDRIYLFNPSEKGCGLEPVPECAKLQERLMALNADTGKVLWERRFNVYLSDVPPHRAAWSAPAVDPETGNIYIYGVGGHLAGIAPDGKILWERPLGEQFGLVTTHGGRTVSPVVDGDLVIVSGISTGWGAQARAAHRFLAFDKKTGETMWVSTPGGRPFDTTYSPPIIAMVNGLRLLIAGGGDGTIHAIKAQTGEPVWKYVVSKRGVNTGVVLNGSTAIVTHSEENLNTSEMGLIAAIDATHKGDITKDQVKWARTGIQGGFSSPVIDGDRVYQVDNGANLFAFDIVSGRTLWQQNLGTIQKASPVFADGKIYVGSENGRFFILRPRNDGCDVLDEDQLGTEQQPEAIIASPAVANGRVYLVTTDATYAIGSKKTVAPTQYMPPPEKAPADAAVAHVQVTPTELVLKPGDSVTFHARLFDAQGRFIREDKATWALAGGLQGTVSDAGKFIAAMDKAGRAGEIRATVGGVTGAARARVIPPLPWSEDFENWPVDQTPPHWINTSGKFVIRQLEGSNKVLVKLADNPFTRRARAFNGPSDWKSYTVQADFFGNEKRRQLGDAGVVAQRYELVLFGSHQRLEIQSWQPERARVVSVPYAWKANTWYRMKLRVEPTSDGKVKALGKVWPVADPEPQAWTIEKIDPIPNLTGSPGLYADAPFEVFFDNYKVSANQ